MQCFFTSCPEEVVNQPFTISRADTPTNNKENYILSSSLINEIFWNYSTITQEKSQFDVLKNIIIPRFSQTIFTPKSNIINSKLIFHFYESLSNLFLEKHQVYLSNIQFYKKQQINFSHEFTGETHIQTAIQLRNKIDNEIQGKTINNLLNFSFYTNLLKPNKIIQLIDANPTDSNLLLDSFLWSIFNSNLDVLFKCFEKTFLFKNVDVSRFTMKESLNGTPVFYNQDYFQSTSIEINQNLLQSNFIYNKNKLNFADPKTCQFAATPNFILLFNSFIDQQQVKHFLKINLCNHNMTEENRFISTKKKFSNDYLVVSNGNDALISDSSGNLYLCNHNYKMLDKFISIRQGLFAHLPLPFTSDGFSIYSIHNNKEIGVYDLDKSKNSLVFVRKIAVNDSTSLDPQFNDNVISTRLLKNASLITNGIELQFILVERIENANFVHFARVISLITGNHIRDFRFELPFPIHSISFDPISRRIWTLTVKENESVFNQFKYKGPDPFWLSKFEISYFSMSLKFNGYLDFVSFLIDYIHSIVSQFYGCEFYSDDQIPSFLTSISGNEMIDLIFCLLSQPPNSFKYIQLLFILLSFQFRYNKMTKEQINTLYQTIGKYISISRLFNFLLMFVITIAPNLKSNDISRFFGLIFKNFDKNVQDKDLLLNLLLRFESNKKFPYLLDNDIPVLLHELFNELNSENINDVGLNFIMCYQSSIFLNYARIYQTKILKIQKTEFMTLNYVSSIFCKALIFIQNIKSIKSVNESSFILVLKKLLIDLRLTAHLSNFILALLPILLKFLKDISRLKFFSESVDNPLYLFYMYVFSLYVFCFKRMLSFSDIETIKKHYSFLDVKMENEKSVSDIFDNKLNDADFEAVVNAIYTKVPNPLNKHLTQEDKDVEKFFFLSIIFKTHALEEIKNLNNQIKENKSIQIPQSIRQIAQTIYRIRSSLRSKRQNGNQNEYRKLHSSYVEKSHFLLRFYSNKFQLKEIADFLNGDVQVCQIIQEQVKLDSVKKNLDLFFMMANSFIVQDLPINIIYFFIMNIADSSDIILANELVKKYLNIKLTSAKELIFNLLENMKIMPPNAILSLICYLLLVLLSSFKPDEIHSFIFETISLTITKLFDESKSFEKIVFRSCISIICHLIRVFGDQKLFIMNQNEIKSLSKKFNELNLNNSMSFSLSHSLHFGLLNLSKPFDFLVQMMGYIGQPKFHQMSLLLFDHLHIFSINNQEKEFMTFYGKILDIIGTVLSGTSSKHLLQIALPTNKVEQAKNNVYIRTPTSQLTCVLDLIQIIRKFILQRESFASKWILKHFKSLSDHFQPDNQQYMKHLYAMLAVMSNMIKIIRPFTLVKTNDNKTYFVLSLDEVNDKLNGLLLPISRQQFYKHELDISNELKSSEIIQYNLSLLKDFELPFSLLKKALNIEKKQSPFSLFKLYTLQWIKENILDSENGKEFSELFFNKIKNRTFKNFLFNNNLPMILSLLKKSLVFEADGIFTNQPLKPQLFHASYTNIVFEKDYTLTETSLKANTSPHVFVSSVINDSKPVYLCIKYDNLKKNFDFGIIVHSIEHNKKISIKYSSQMSKFFINGEKTSDYKLKINTSIECLYLPSKNLVSFADSVNNSNVIFLCDLGQKLKCSFFVLAYPGTELQYSCDLNPQTTCFINHQNSKYSRINQGITPISLLFQKDYTEELEGIIHYTNELKAMTYSKDKLLSTDETISVKLFTLTKFNNLPETDLFMAQYTNSYYTSLLNIYSSPIQLKDYIQIYDVSGTFKMINSDNAIIENSNSIPAFNIQKYHYLPSEILNSYIIEACEFYQQEMLTFIAVQVFASSKDIYSSLNHFSMTTSAVINFITSVLFLLEPIKLSNLNDSMSPIDFLEFNGFKSCSKTDMYDYFTAVTQIIDYISENDKEKFTYKWFKRLQKDFRSKYMHFVSQKNNSIINVRSSIIDSYQTFDLDDATGWIIFPYKFGCYKMPPLSINHLIFPKLFNENVNYAYSGSKILRLKANYIVRRPNVSPPSDELITFGIIPLFGKSNESLFYSFYHLAVSFKYFVLFAQNNMPEKMKDQIWKLVINSIVAGSPFFYSHCYTVLLFLQKKLQIELTPENTAMLNSLHFSNSVLKNTSISRFMHYQSFALINEMSTKLEHFVIDLDQKAPSNIIVKDPIIPSKIISSVNVEIMAEVIANVLTYKETANSKFPYYLILYEWVESFCNLPPSRIETISPNVVKITFLSFVPDTFQLIARGFRYYGQVQISTQSDFNPSKNYSSTSIKTDISYDLRYKPNTSNVFYVKFINDSNISNYRFFVWSFAYIRPNDTSNVVYDFRSTLKNDISDFCTKFTPKDDQDILNIFNPMKFTKKPFETRPTSFEIQELTNFNHPPHLCYFRSIYLTTVNNLFLTEKSISKEFSKMNLERFLSNNLFLTKFKNLINARNSSSFLTLRIDRQKGLDYRNGISNLEQNSMIAQFTNEYIRNPNSFRNHETPFKINYKNENGVDLGGLMRDFFTELITDIKTPRVGLFIQTPNGRNHEGNFQDCIVPAPAPEISKSDKYYQSVGALIAIAIRTEMKQPDLMFPPFFWRFIITGKLNIEDIYEIDKSYKDLTANLLHSANEMTDNEFENLISSTTISNIRGNPLRMGLRNSLIRLSRSNCAHFIAICNEFRINELINPLNKIKAGFWQNLNIEPPPFVTPSLIELMACGNRIITVDDIRAAATFVGVLNDQRNYFWEVVTRMSNDDRKKLIHFSTGLNSLSSHGLKIDSMSIGRIDHLPTASTCFFSLHLPPYSSADKMYNAFMIAINETGTFENA